MAKITIAPSTTSTPTNVASSTASNPLPSQQAEPVNTAEPASPISAPAAPVAEPVVNTPVSTAEPIREPVSNEPVIEPIKKEEPTNVTKITFGAPDQKPDEPITATQQQQKITPQDILKTIPKDELYKFLELDEHTLRFDEHRKKGGNPYDFIEQRAIDWTKVPDEQLIKMDLRKQNPKLSSEKIDKLYVHKYKQDELSTDDDKDFGSILLEADADSIRRRNIEEQKKNEIVPINAPQQPNEYEDKFKSQQKQWDEFYNDFVGNENIKKFVTEKKITFNVGNDKLYTFEVENPNYLIDAVFGKNAQGKPDPQLLLQAALFRLAPQQFIDGFVNYGKSLALLDELLKDGQNATATKPQGNAPRQSGVSTNKKITPSNSRITNYGG